MNDENQEVLLLDDLIRDYLQIAEKQHDLACRYGIEIGTPHFQAYLPLISLIRAIRKQPKKIQRLRYWHESGSIFARVKAIDDKFRERGAITLVGTIGDGCFVADVE